jgi:DNA-binding MarR family transcriptional regulator
MVGGALRKRALVTRPASDTPPPPPSASVADYELEAQVGYRIRRAHQRATDIFSQIMAQFDVTPTQFAALAKLHDLGLVSQNHLGRLTGMDPSTILGVVGRLIRQGHVRARPDPADGRLTLLELTTNGRTQIEAMKMVAPKVSEKTLEPLSPKDQKILLELLEKLA